MTFTATHQTITVAGLLGISVVGLALLLVHHLLTDWREARTRRRDRELHRSRIEAHTARKWAQIAADDEGMARCRAERDAANRLAVQMLHRNDQLEAQVARMAGELAGARASMSRVNRPQLARLAHAIEQTSTRTEPIPVLSVPAVTRQLPAVTTHDRRRVLRSA